MKRDYIYLIIISLLIIALLKLNNSNDKIVENGAYKKHIIDIDRANTLQQEYLKKRKNMFQTQLREEYRDSTFEDTEFVWFPLESIKSYLNFIDEIQTNHPNEDISGLRIYFMAYPKSSNRYKGQQSIFAVPTVRYNFPDNNYETMNNLPFYLSSMDKEKPFEGTIEIYQELMTNHRLKERVNNFNKRKNSKIEKASFGFETNFILSMSTESFNTSTIFNEGEAYPPPKK